MCLLHNTTSKDVIYAVPFSSSPLFFPVFDYLTNYKLIESVIKEFYGNLMWKFEEMNYLLNLKKNRIYIFQYEGATIKFDFQKL